MDPMVWLLRNRYGSLELSRQVGPNLLRGLIISMLIHSAVVGSFYVSGLLQRESADLWGPSIVLPPPRFPRPQAPPQEVPARPRPQPPVSVGQPISVDDPPPVVNPLPSPPVGRTGTGDPDLTDSPPIDIPTGTINDDGETIPTPGTWIPREIEPAPLTTNPQPAYPQIPRIAGTSGRVVAQVFVDKHGNIQKWIIASANPENLGFEEEVAKVISKWKFAPALQQNQPVGVWVSIPFVFSIRR